MLMDGIYKIAYSQGPQPQDDEIALAVVRNGKVFASDQNGGVYISDVTKTLTEQISISYITALVPPHGMLVTGIEAGADGAEIEMTAIVDPTRERQTAKLDLAGTTIEIDVIYIGPLPT